MYTRLRQTNERPKTLRESYIYKGVRYWREAAAPEPGTLKEGLLRDSIGTVLRERRFELGLNLRQMGSVSLGYVSEVERGKKEVSSEILQTMCQSLDISVAEILRRTADLMETPYLDSTRKELAHV